MKLGKLYDKLKHGEHIIVRINPCISYGSILFFEKGVDELDKILKKMDVYSISVVDSSIFVDVLND